MLRTPTQAKPVDSGISKPNPIKSISGVQPPLHKRLKTSPVNAGCCSWCKVNQQRGPNKSTANRLRYYKVPSHELEIFSRRGRLNANGFSKVCISCFQKKRRAEVRLFVAARKHLVTFQSQDLMLCLTNFKLLNSSANFQLT